jgi:anti-sigma factor (TIGR02949 family)
VDCKEFQEQVSAAVDRCLTKEEMESFASHADKCPACNYEYQSESLTKSVVQNKAKMVRTPGLLVQRITEQLHSEKIAATKTEKSWWLTIFARPYVKPAIAFGVACVAMLFLLTPSKNTPNNPPTHSLITSNVIDQSLANYSAIVNGGITPQVASSEPANVMRLFTGKTDFPVVMPTMKDCRLVGGVLNEYSGAVLAHVVYKHDNDVIYMYQACLETVMKGEKLSLPPATTEELQRTGWSAATQPDGRTFVLWTKGPTLCVAVSRMNKADLIACLTSGESSSANPW